METAGLCLCYSGGGRRVVGLLRDVQARVFLYRGLNYRVWGKDSKTYTSLCVYIICMHTCIHTYLRTYVQSYVHTDVRTRVRSYIGNMRTFSCP